MITEGEKQRIVELIRDAADAIENMEVDTGSEGLDSQTQVLVIMMAVAIAIPRESFNALKLAEDDKFDESRIAVNNAVNAAEQLLEQVKSLRVDLRRYETLTIIEENT